MGWERDRFIDILGWNWAGWSHPEQRAEDSQVVEQHPLFTCPSAPEKFCMHGNPISSLLPPFLQLGPAWPKTLERLLLLLGTSVLSTALHS